MVHKLFLLTLVYCTSDVELTGTNAFIARWSSPIYTQHWPIPLVSYQDAVQSGLTKCFKKMCMKDVTGILVVRGSCLFQKLKNWTYSTYTSICSDGDINPCMDRECLLHLIVSAMGLVARLPQSSERQSAEVYFEVIRSLSSHMHCKWNVLSCSHSDLSIFQTDCGPLSMNSLLNSFPN